MNDLCLEEAVDRLGERVVITVADAADRRFDAGLGQALGVFDRQVLRSAIRVMHQARSRPSLMNGLFQGIQDEPGVGRAAHSPSDNAAREGVDDEGDVDEALPSGDIGEIAHPKHVRRRHAELAVHLVQRAWLRLVGIVVLIFLPRMRHEAHVLHQPLDATVHRATSNPSRRIWRQTLRTP
jgi:hypothetical protein